MTKRAGWNVPGPQSCIKNLQHTIQERKTSRYLNVDADSFGLSALIMSCMLERRNTQEEYIQSCAPSVWNNHQQRFNAWAEKQSKSKNSQIFLK